MSGADYLSNETLHHEVVLSQRQGHPTDAMGAMLLMMAERIMRMRRFANYGYRDDLISAAVLHGIQAYKKYSPSKGNAFSWFTSVITNAALKYIREENRQDKIALRYAESRGVRRPQN